MRLVEPFPGHSNTPLRLPSMLLNMTTFRYFVYLLCLGECIRIFSYRTVHPMRGTVQRVQCIVFVSIGESVHKYHVRKYWF